jgi:hypothetical protein
MKINNEQIEFFQKANKILQTPNHFPDGNKVVDYYKEIYADEIEQKKSPYYRSLSPGCLSCIRFCVFTVKNDLVKMKILDIKGDYIKNK